MLSWIYNLFLFDGLWEQDTSWRHIHWSGGSLNSEADVGNFLEAYTLVLGSIWWEVVGVHLIEVYKAGGFYFGDTIYYIVIVSEMRYLLPENAARLSEPGLHMLHTYVLKLLPSIGSSPAFLPQQRILLVG